MENTIDIQIMTQEEPFFLYKQKADVLTSMKPKETEASAKGKPEKHGKLAADEMLVRIIEKTDQKTREAFKKVNSRGLDISIPQNSVIDIKIVDKNTGEVIEHVPRVKPDLQKINIMYNSYADKIMAGV